MKYLKIRVPLGKTKAGDDVFITREFGDAIEALFATLVAATTTAVVTTTGPTTADLAALAARVAKLEGGYQA